MFGGKVLTPVGLKTVATLMDQVNFNFKAATGFGAVVDGSVVSTGAERVARDLIRQGLIPVRIWAEQPSRAGNLHSFARAVGGWLGRCRSLLYHA